MGGPIESLTLSTSEWPSDAVVCSLSDVLEGGELPPQYYLSAKACQGILRRAANRGKQLPPLLQQALAAVAAQADDYTRIPMGKKGNRWAKDGPRYTALGNSMAVPVMHWIGQRIAAVDRLMRPDRYADT